MNLTGIDTLPSNLFPEDLAVPVIVLIIPYFILILVAGGGQEEFGWRGYAQEPLQNRFGILRGSILLGTVWGTWHLPLWFMPGEGHAYYSFFAFLIYTVSMSVIIGWLYNLSGKKLIIPWITHAISNVSVPFFPMLHMADVPQPGYWVWVWIHVFVAIGITIWFMKKKP
ncbi:CPBP family intramembrane glutamic endopeptidase [Dethiosulfatibacter aminovorans]|uniref:CPBP family intramembrane glutamic endopeptidase n=1 Tax=Dethiosulfatibacter aminovorans TaxID=332095 RepID=UPI001FEC3CDE|nr:CPBP family intramembrane glutamic endopeptidase [Dethiosulfatibacter aminovorans]